MADDERMRIPFGLHQLCEYLIAVVLLASAWYSPEPAVQATMGALVLANAALSDGPLGAFHTIPRPVHRWIDLGIIVLLLGAALPGWFDVGTTGRIALPLMAAALVVLWFTTDFREPGDAHGG